MHYQLNEHFWSIQGEGEHAGHTAVFLRLQGCPVGCAWCDSKLTWYAGGERLTAEQVFDVVRTYPESELIVVTGDEPLLYDLDPLFQGLKEHFPSRSLHIETSGAYPFKGMLRPDWTTVSPKYPVEFAVAENVMAAASEFKYVVDELFSPDIVAMHVRQRENCGREAPPIRLMPEGSPPRPEMVNRTLQLLREHPTWCFGPRLQYNYGPIAEGEGLNNKQVLAEDAKSTARGRRRIREARMQTAS